MVTNRQIGRALQLVRRAISAWEPPALNKIAEESHDPFRVLISCILSQQTKARTIREVCRTLLTRFAGRVPDSLETLLSLKGVGRKTANLVVTVGYRKSGICVDTHVHRISNRWGYVTTKTPEQTEMALRRKLPKRHWIYYNDLLVPFGQHLCRPISPFCSPCPVERWCARIGVTIHR